MRVFVVTLMCGISAAIAGAQYSGWFGMPKSATAFEADSTTQERSFELSPEQHERISLLNQEHQKRFEQFLQKHRSDTTLMPVRVSTGSDASARGGQFANAFENALRTMQSDYDEKYRNILTPQQRSLLDSLRKSSVVDDSAKSQGRESRGDL